MKENYFEEYNRIASKIKVLRTAKHLTQEQLSELSGLSISYISKIEAPNCNKSFSLDALFILAEVLTSSKLPESSKFTFQSLSYQIKVILLYDCGYDFYFFHIYITCMYHIKSSIGLQSSYTSVIFVLKLK